MTTVGPAVLGLDGLRALNVQVALNIHQQPPLPEDIKYLIVQCANNRGGMKIDPIHLETTGDPIFMKTRPLAFGMRAAVRSKLDEMIQDGVLESLSTARWATPIVTVLKPDGKPRICGDYRITVNPHLQQTASTTPDVESMFEGLSGRAYFSKLDLSNAFHQIPLDEVSSNLTTINTIWGLFRYRFLPFGLNVSPGVFQ